MKNIHLISTDKLSRLIKLSNGELKYNENSGLHSFYPQNIYITSDEEIKEGDWVICLENIFKNEIFKVDSDVPNKSCNVTLEFAKKYLTKIILTTDQDLIKDGVQAIPDKFLEWFVKNPSCEFVKVIPDVMASIYYEIIIPKEEHNKFLSCCKSLEECHCGKKKEEDIITIPKVYTEEEMRDIVNKTVDKFCPYFFQEMKLQVAEEWFNQIKK